MRGSVTLIENGDLVHGAVVLIVGTGLVTLTDDQGRFEVENVPTGTYEVLAQREHLTAGRQTITVEAGQAHELSFELGLSPVHEEVTVTATAGGRITAFEAFNAITTLDSFELVTDPRSTLGDALENQPGVAKRSFGPGSSRPIIRGFDGDRVLMMEDGIRTGDLASQSGDHGVTIDPNGLERIEIVRGPATLLYGSNAVGGVVNAITPHESYRDSMTEGVRGQFSADGGSANDQAGTNASMQHARGNLMIWAGGGARRTGDYDTPLRTIENSATSLATGRAGVGYFGERLFASGGFTIEDGRYGVPFAVESEGEVLVDIDSLRRAGRFDIGLRNLGNRVVESFRVVFNVIDWQHDEIEIDEGIETIGTVFDNRTYVVRAELDQRQTNRLSGKLGAWMHVRDYIATGEEALTPPTEQTAIAAFAYEELDLGRSRVQLGARVERTDYTVAAREVGGRVERQGAEDLEPPEVRDRDFAGMSASVGVQTDLGAEGTFVATLTRSYRAPALEELYNFGPHVGTLVFDIGNPDLGREATLGLDISLRHQSEQLRGDFNLYVYDIDNFVFSRVTDEEVDGLRIAEFLQQDSRFIGFDAKASLQLGNRIWANLGVGLVDAELTATSEALPRIPPLRGQLSVDFPYRGFTITPEWVFAAKQNRVFRNETETNGYSVLNVRASYVWPMQHVAHILSVAGYNLTNELYLNHTSFIKDLAPEIGRGVRFGYSMRFF